MTEKKIDKKVNEVLQEKDLDKVNGGLYIGRKTDAKTPIEQKSENNVPNIHWQSRREL